MAGSTRRSRSLRRMAVRGLSVVRDPAVLLASGFGAGVGWAVNLPLGAAAAIGAGMLGAAGVAKALSTEGAEYVGAAGLPELRRGTRQADLVARLRRVAGQLESMEASFAGTSLGSSVVEAATGASSAVESAHRLAAAVDSIDSALAGMSDVFAAPDPNASPQARRSATERAAVAGRMRGRRDELIGRIEAAYLRAEDVRVRLLEVSAALHAPSADPAAESGLAAVSDNLDQLRRGLEELEQTAARELPDTPPTRGAAG